MGRTSVQVVARRSTTLGLRDRHRDQRKKIIKMCVKKLRDIDDPETVLCRAVLINNTFRTLKTAQRQLLRKARRRIEQQDSSEEEEEEEEGKKEEEEPVVEVETPLPTEPLSTLISETGPDTFTHDELDDSTSCDLSCSDVGLVHSLVMPPLLSPHIEDMTNCSFYDSFGPVELDGQDTGQLSPTEHFQKDGKDRDNMSASIKLTLMKSTLCDVIQENNSNSQTGFQFPKSEFGGCGVQGETGDSLLDNLLTEIARA